MAGTTLTQAAVNKLIDEALEEFVRKDEFEDEFKNTDGLKDYVRNFIKEILEEEKESTDTDAGTNNGAPDPLPAQEGIPVGGGIWWAGNGRDNQIPENYELNRHMGMKNGFVVIHRVK